MVSIFYFFGMIAAVIAAYIGYDAETMSASIDGIANAHLMHIQISKLIFALVFGIIAAILLSAGAIIQAIQSKD